jgi:hypothetical protein
LAFWIKPLPDLNAVIRDENVAQPPNRLDEMRIARVGFD